MRTTLLAALAVAATVLAGLGPASASDPDGGPDPQAPVRIMLAGDSITQGFDGDFTWRYRLFEEFRRQAVPVDFVGPRQLPYGASGVYLENGWDSDHDALGGSRLSSAIVSIGADVATYLPDVLVAEYGTNDLLNGATVTQVLDRWRTYIANARAARPDVALVVGEVATPKARDRAEANEGLHALAVELATPESPIVVADLDSPAWVPSLDSRDLVHPNPTGETVIAQKIGEALRSLGVLPATPEIARGFVPWTPALDPVVRRQGRRLVVSWAQARRRYRVHAVQVRVTNLRTGHAQTWKYARRPTHLVTGPLRRGGYRVDLRGWRGTTRSEWGRAVVRRIG